MSNNEPVRPVASEVTPEQVGIYAGNEAPSDTPNPHKAQLVIDPADVEDARNPTVDRDQIFQTVQLTDIDAPGRPASADGDQTGAPPTNEPEAFDPRMMGEPEPGPLELPPARSRNRRRGTFPDIDTGTEARDKLKDRSLKARARRLWNWIKFICFLLILVAGGLLYWQYTVRAHTYVVEPRICFFETADKQVRITGTRYYSYMQNDMLGLRWHLAEDTTVKTEIDLKGNAMVIASLGGKDGPTSKYISMGELGKEPLPRADTYVITMDKRSVVLTDETFCR